MLGQYSRSKGWVLGWVPIILIVHQSGAHATLSETSTASTQVTSTHKLSKQSARQLSTAANPPLETTNQLLEPPNPLPTRESHNQASPTLSFAIADDFKPDLDKSQLANAYPNIYAFMTQQPEFAAAPPPPLGLGQINDRTPEPPEIAQEPPQAGDPELGVVRLRDPRQDPELGIIRLRNSLQDPELGILRLRPVAVDPPPRPSVFLSGYVTASSSDNVFLVDDPVRGRLGDTFIRPGLSLIAFPSIGPNTNLLASVESNFLRYQDFSESSYDELRFRAGIRHSFSNRVYGQLSWSSQLLFDEGFDDQFFTNHGIELFLGRRDPLLPGLTLDSYYQGQLHFSNPSKFSNIVQTLGISLDYRFNPQWATQVGYQITVSDFTQTSRHETYQRVTGQLRYSLSPAVRMSIFGGISYGRSSRDTISFDNSFFGISLDATIEIF